MPDITAVGADAPNDPLGPAFRALLADLPAGPMVRILLGRKTGQWAVKMDRLTGTGSTLEDAVLDLVEKRSRR